MTIRQYENRTLLITAGATRTGAAIARYCLSQGARVFLNFHTNFKGANQVASEFPKDRVVLLQGDVTNPETVEQMFAEIKGFGFGLDGVINVVGDYHQEPVMGTSLDRFHHVLHNNLDSAFLLAQGAYPFLREAKSARFINFGYAKGDRVTSAQCWAYHIAKMGVISLSKTLAKEWGPDQIAVHTISPGTLFNSIVTESENPEDYIPQGRFGEYADLWPVLDLIFDPRSTYQTGNNFILSGGYNV